MRVPSEIASRQLQCFCSKFCCNLSVEVSEGREMERCGCTGERNRYSTVLHMQGITLITAHKHSHAQKKATNLIKAEREDAVPLIHQTMGRHGNVAHIVITGARER